MVIVETHSEEIAGGFYECDKTAQKLRLRCTRWISKTIGSPLSRHQNGFLAPLTTPYQPEMPIPVHKIACLHDVDMQPSVVCKFCQFWPYTRIWASSISTLGKEVVAEIWPSRLLQFREEIYSLEDIKPGQGHRLSNCSDEHMERFCYERKAGGWKVEAVNCKHESGFRLFISEKYYWQLTWCKLPRRPRMCKSEQHHWGYSSLLSMMLPACDSFISKED